MRVSIARLAAALALAACAESPTTVPTATLQSTDATVSQRDEPQLVPYRIVLTSGRSTIVPGGRCGAGFPIVTVLGEGSGVGTHLGRLTVATSHCQNQAQPEAGFSDGIITITGADGSTVNATYYGIGIPTNVPTIVNLVGAFTVVGGTGRFVGATGSGSIDGTFNVVTLETVWTATGTISTVGSSK
jgi:hypothetical protein